MQLSYKNSILAVLVSNTYLTMKRIFIVSVFMVALLSGRLHAQFNHVSIGGEVNIPSGNSSNISAIGLGGGIKAEVVLSTRVALTANGSVVSFLGRRFLGVTSPAQTSIPVKGGFKYYTSPNFYFEGQLGANFPTGDQANTGFVWSPGLGGFIKLRNSDHKIDVGLRYESWSSARNIGSPNARTSSFGFVGLRVAYAFSL